jgi:hypothetical protein
MEWILLLFMKTNNSVASEQIPFNTEEQCLQAVRGIYEVVDTTPTGLSGWVSPYAFCVEHEKVDKR